jgi:predicted DsbA family dithiol-disulfide isomerase
MPALSFEYWSDPLCIWAFVAQPKLDALLRDHGGELAVDHRLVPVFGSIPWRFREGSWAKAGPEGRREATARIAREFGHTTVTGAAWTDHAPASSWAPGVAIKAVFAMEHAGAAPEGAGARYLTALRAAFFVDNRNTALRHEQLAVAEALELDRAPLEQRLDDGTALAALWEDDRERETKRIQGSPTYVFDGGRARLYGNFDEQVLRATVRTMLDGLQAGGSAC